VDPLLEVLVVQFLFTKEENRNMEKVKTIMTKLKDKMGFISKELGKNEFMLENRLTAVDIALGYSLYLATQFKVIEGMKELEEYYERLSSREEFKRAFGKEETKELKEMRQKLKKLELDNKKLSGEDEITVYHYPGIILIKTKGHVQSEWCGY
jgi:glutathione S-transferase